MIPDFQSANYGYYPRLMIRLAAASYEAMGLIPNIVQSLGLKAVWGPAELVDSFGVSYSRAFVCVRPSTGEYTVVIRGTNEYSAWSWWSEDLDVATTVPFPQLVADAPADALISKATSDGIEDLLQLRDPATRTGMVQYLSAARPRSIYVTGHSLGGTLVSPMAALLNHNIYGGGSTGPVAMWSFAGLTPGNAGFARYFNGLFNPEFPWRLHNTLDVAPFCWYSLQDVATIYGPYGLSWGEPESGTITDVFDSGAKVGYVHPSGDRPLPGAFFTGWDSWSWDLQAMAQHHTGTYQTLVDRVYPTPSEAKLRHGT